MYLSLKRILDIVVSLLGIVILFPLLLIVGLLIYIDSKGPIIFKQQRIGQEGKLFYIYKSFFSSQLKDEYNRKVMVGVMGSIVILLPILLPTEQVQLYPHSWFWKRGQSTNTSHFRQCNVSYKHFFFLVSRIIWIASMKL